MYELAIIGGGPAAIAAGVYAGRKQIKTIFLTETFGGQSIVSDDIQNWIGDLQVSGFDLAKRFEAHIRTQQTLDIKTGVRVNKIIKNGELPEGHFILQTEKGETFEAKTVLVASGSRRRRLGVPGEDQFEGKGVVFCSTCDAPIFKDKKVVVVGGGNAGLEAVIDLIPYATHITLVIRGAEMKGDAITQEKIKSSSKVDILFNAETQEIKGDKTVTALIYKDKVSEELKELPTDGVFVEIGAVPNADFLKDIAELNPIGEVVVNHQTQETSCKGIWAAGDVTDVLYKQNNISAGDAVKGLLHLYEFLHKNIKTEAHQ